MKINKIHISKSQVLTLSIFIFSLVFFSLSSGSFLSLGNWMNILSTTSYIAIPALGLATVMLTGYFDLSFVGVVGIASVLNVTLDQMGINPVLILIITLIVAISLELFNGFMIISLGIHPWLCTIATMLTYLGLEMAISKGGLYLTDLIFFPSNKA